MTKTEAVAMLVKGEKLTHVAFLQHEYVMLENDHYVFEDTSTCNIKEFWYVRRDDSWLTGWSIFKDVV